MRQLRVVTKKILVLILFSTIALPLFAQIKLPKANFNFDFPENGWKYLQTTKIDKNSNIYLYSKKTCIISEKGDTALPFLRIYIKNDVENTSSIDFAMERFINQPFTVLDEYTSSQHLPTEDAIGYVGQYKDQDGQICKFRMIYFVHNKTLVEFRLETTEATFDSMKDEFEMILNTITLN